MKCVVLSTTGLGCLSTLTITPTTNFAHPVHPTHLPSIVGTIVVVIGVLVLVLVVLVESQFKASHLPSLSFFGRAWIRLLIVLELVVALVVALILFPLRCIVSALKMRSGGVELRGE